MNTTDQAGTFQLGDRTIRRMGYGAMQLAGPHVFGSPKDRDAAIAVLRAVVDAGVNHIDTSDFYGPRVVNEIIRKALTPYPDELVIVTKVGTIAAMMDHGTSPRRPMNYAARLRTICGTSGSTRWRW